MNTGNAHIVYEKTDPVKRLIAVIIDLLVAYLIGVIPLLGGIIGAGYMLLRDALPIEALEYKSIGKKVMKLSVVKTGAPGTKIEYMDSVNRNWMFAMGPVMMLFLFIPVIGWLINVVLALGGLCIGVYEVYRVFSDPEGLRLGDQMADTMVVDDNPGR